MRSLVIMGLCYHQCVPCLSADTPAWTAGIAVTLLLSAGVSSSPNHRASPELLPTTQENVQLHTGVLEPSLPPSQKVRPKFSLLPSSSRSPGHKLLSLEIHIRVYCNLSLLPQNCRIISFAGRKPHPNSIRLSSKSVILGIAFVFLGDSVSVFKIPFPPIIPMSFRSVLKFRNEALTSFFPFASLA